MTTITLGIPIEPAALEVAQELQRRGADAQPPLDLISLALVYWSEAEIAQLLDRAPTHLSYDTPEGSRLIRALNYVARWEDGLPPLRTLRDRRKAARVLALRHHLRVEDWMLWTIWETQIGCNTCQLLGPSADCWGQRECHGYENGCGCNECTTRSRISRLNALEELP